jgi:hypothetical protein
MRPAASALLAAGVLAASLYAPGGALGAGGANISGAPLAPAGAPQTGDTATDPVAIGAPCGHGLLGLNRTEYWRLDLTTGDQVSILGSQGPPVLGVDICAYPPGTEDGNVQGAQGPEGQSLQEGLGFHVSGGGTWTVALTPYLLPGPFSFTITVLHEALLYLPPKATIGLSGRIFAFARTPDGDPVPDRALRLELLGSWRDRPFLPASAHLLSSATPLRGKASLAFRLPHRLAGHRLGLTLTASGPGYEPVRSVTGLARVRLPRRAP